MAHPGIRDTACLHDNDALHELDGAYLDADSDILGPCHVEDARFASCYNLPWLGVRAVEAPVRTMRTR